VTIRSREATKAGLYEYAPQTDTLLVSEIFGPTIQGEGPSAGRRAVFLRLGGCNLTCLGCDTPYTWRWSADLPHRDDTVYDARTELRRITHSDIAEQINAIVGERKHTLLVITGGEPLLQATSLSNFVRYFRNLGDKMQIGRPSIEVETNGTRPPTRQLVAIVNQWNVSPKLSHWGNDPAKSYKPEVLQAFLDTGKAVFKFVCVDELDVAEADRLRKNAGLPIERCWVMPEGTTPTDVLLHGEAIRDRALSLGFNISTRIHVLLHGADKRGT
jgi:7-carboxy-7-deazaguanine synthase